MQQLKKASLFYLLDTANLPRHLTYNTIYSVHWRHMSKTNTTPYILFRYIVLSTFYFLKIGEGFGCKQIAATFKNNAFIWIEGINIYAISHVE